MTHSHIQPKKQGNKNSIGSGEGEVVGKKIQMGDKKYRGGSIDKIGWVGTLCQLWIRRTFWKNIRQSYLHTDENN